MYASTYPVGRPKVDIGPLLDDVLHGLVGSLAVIGHSVEDEVVKDGLVVGEGAHRHCRHLATLDLVHDPHGIAAHHFPDLAVVHLWNKCQDKGLLKDSVQNKL